VFEKEKEACKCFDETIFRNIIGDNMGIPQLSYSMLCTFMHCKRFYYYKYHLALEIAGLHMPFFTGGCVNHGVQYIMAGGKDVETEIKKHMKKEVKKIRAENFLSIENETALEEQQIIIRGIVSAYKKKYRKTFLKSIKKAESEYVVVKDFDKFRVKVKIDNLIKSKAGIILHELKTTKTLNVEYVRQIQSDFQTCLYYHIYNIENPKYPVEHIVYDVIRKPSIRQRQNETKTQYLRRLGQYYEDDASDNLFHMETRKAPIISEKLTLKAIQGAFRDMKRCRKPDDYYCNYAGCYVYYGKCDYYDLCYAENKREYKFAMGKYKINQKIVKGRKYGTSR